MRSALITEDTHQVVNIILADPSVDSAPEGHYLVPIDKLPPVEIGDTYDMKSGEFTSPLSLPPGPVIPTSLTPRQLRLILNAYGLLDQVEALVATQDKAIQLAWEYATTFLRDDQLLNTMAQHLGITQEQIDTMFIEGATI